MVRSERTIGGFFHQGVGERPEAFQERLLLLGRERLERPPERAVAAFQPFVHPVRCERVQVDDRPTPVVHVLAPVDERGVLEVAGQLARGRERQSELACELADRALALAADLREHGHVPARQTRIASHQRLQVVAGSPPLPEPSRDAAQQPAELTKPAVSYHLTLVIIE